MKKVVILPSFEKCVKRLSYEDKKRLADKLDAFNEVLRTGRAAHGFGFKKINHDKYEFRVSIRLRIILKLENDIYYLVLAGSHDDIRRYLRNYR